MDDEWRQVEAVGPTTAEVPALYGKDEGTTTSTAAKEKGSGGDSFGDDRYPSRGVRSR